jgi:predicted AAA+ superfamily ATPase
MSYRRLLSPPARSFFLFGARGTGKSTWIRENIDAALVVDLLKHELYADLLARPGLLADRARALRPGAWVVIDEVQRVPALLNEVHSLIEEKKLKFVLSGSSARQLRKSGTNLLAGRASQRFFFPFLPEELGPDFELDRALRFGTLPIVWTAEDPKDVLRAYTQTYLREEIQAEALVRNLQGFVRFLPIASAFHGQLLNASNIAREAGVARTTVGGYAEILEDTLLAFRLPAYEAKLRVKERKHPKFYFIDPGLVRALQKRFDPPTGSELGPLFEGFVASCLRALGLYRDAFDEIFYWASAESQVEVDFILKRGSELWAIEAKASSRFHPSMTKGLAAMKGLKGLKRRIVVYGGRDRLLLDDGVEVMSVTELLAEVSK